MVVNYVLVAVFLTGAGLLGWLAWRAWHLLSQHSLGLPPTCCSCRPCASDSKKSGDVGSLGPLKLPLRAVNDRLLAGRRDSSGSPQHTSVKWRAKLTQRHRPSIRRVLMNILI